MSSVLDVNSTYRFQATLTKDGVTWDLTGATVYLRLTKPDGTTAQKTASVDSALAGTVHYDTLTSDLDQAGYWARAWRVVQGGIDVTSTPPVSFLVINSP